MQILKERFDRIVYVEYLKKAKMKTTLNIENVFSVVRSKEFE